MIGLKPIKIPSAKERVASELRKAILSKQLKEGENLTLESLMDYTDHPRDVADPWYTGDFEATWQDVLEGCQGLLDSIIRKEV